MRPPLNAGENLASIEGERGDVRASMRPPLNAGENPCIGGGGGAQPSGLQ